MFYTIYRIMLCGHCLASTMNRQAANDLMYQFSPAPVTLVTDSIEIN